MFWWMCSQVWGKGVPLWAHAEASLHPEGPATWYSIERLFHQQPAAKTRVKEGSEFRKAKDSSSLGWKL